MIIGLTLYLFIVVIFSMTNFNGQDPAASTIDLSGDITIGGQLTAEGGILLPDGKDSAPSLAFVLDTKTGIERSGTSEMSFVSNGSKRLKIGATSVTSLVPILEIDGQVSAPSYSFSSNTGTGMYQSAFQSALALAFNGHTIGNFNSTATSITSSSFVLGNPDGGTTFSLSPSTGATDVITASFGATNVATYTTTSTTISPRLAVTNGGTSFDTLPTGGTVVQSISGVPVTSLSTSEITLFTPDFTIFNSSDSTAIDLIPVSGHLTAKLNSNTLFQTIGSSGSVDIQWNGTQTGTDTSFTNGTFTNCTCTNLTSTNLTSTAITTQTIQTNSIVSSLQPFGIWTFSAYSVPVATIATSGTTIVSVPYPTVALAPVGVAITYSAGVFTLQPGDYEVEVTNNWTPTTTNNLRLHRIIFNGTIWQNTTTTQGVVGTGNFGCTIMTHSLLHASSPSTLSVDLQNQSTVLVWLIDLGRISIRKLG